MAKEIKTGHLKHHSFHIKEFFRTLHKKRWGRGVMYVFMNLFLPFVGFYSHFIEPRLIKISHLTVPIRKLPKAFHRLRIIQLSDIHFGPTNKSVAYLNKCIRMVNHLKPDIVAMTGDFMQWDSKYAEPLAKTLSAIKTRMGSFAVLGNHDYGVCHPNENASDPVDYREVMRALSQNGIRVLHNAASILKKGAEKLKIVGLGDYWTPFFKPEKAFGTGKKITSRKAALRGRLQSGFVPKGTLWVRRRGRREPQKINPTILLSHNPDSIQKLKEFPFDLMLCGHVHGGQFSLPWIGPFAVPVKLRKLRRGLHRIGQKWLYANRGLGYTFKARLLSRPEITCLELVSAST